MIDRDEGDKPMTRRQVNHGRAKALAAELLDKLTRATHEERNLLVTGWVTPRVTRGSGQDAYEVAVFIGTLVGALDRLANVAGREAVEFAEIVSRIEANRG